MLWPIIAAGGVGLLLGLLIVRVHLVIAASMVLALTCGAVALLAQWSILGGIASAFAHVAVLQVSYLGGVLFSSACPRAKAPQAVLRSSRVDQ